MNIMDLDNITCDECKSKMFYQMFMLKKIPAVISQSGNETVAPVMSGFACVACGHVNDEFKIKEDKKEVKPKSNIILP